MKRILPILAIVLAACAGRHAPATASARGEIRGRLLVAGGHADGIEVRLCRAGKNRSAVTGSNGAFRFDGLETGPAIVFVSEATLGIDVKPVTIADAAPAEVELQPQPAGRISGTVVDDNGNPIPGAKVQLVPRLGGDAGMSHPEETAAGHIPEEAISCLRAVSTRVITDKEGRFAVANVIGEQGVRIVVDAAGWFDLGPEGGGPRNVPPGTLELEIDLTHRGRVEGNVRGKDDGFVAADAKGFRKVVPLKAGHYSLSLEPGVYDVYYVDADAKKRNNSSSRPFAHHGPAQNITVRAGSTSRSDLDPEK